MGTGHAGTRAFCQYDSATRLFGASLVSCRYCRCVACRQTIREGTWLDVEQARALLSVVPKNAMGRHNFALLVALLVTGLRLSQVRKWRWDENRSLGGRLVIQNQTLPGVVLEALQAAREDSHSGNMDPRVDIPAGPYIFTAMASRRCVGQWGRPSQQSINAPLSPQEINRHIGRYARLAGLEPQGTQQNAFVARAESLANGWSPPVLDARHARPVRWKQVKHDPRLHGIGRRSL